MVNNNVDKKENKLKKETQYFRSDINFIEDDSKKQEGYISICPNCHYMTHIIKGKCGKCGFAL